MKLKSMLIVFLLVTLVFIIGCSSNSDIVNDESGVVSKLSAPGFEDIEETVVDDLKEFNIIAKQWRFEPDIIEINKGDRIKLNVKSIDVTHGFALPDFDVKIDLVPNKEETVEFTADKKGEFTFFCSVMCGEGHRDMNGKLIVE